MTTMSIPFQMEENVLKEFRPGVWGFVGNVTPILALVTKDGQTPTPKQIENARQFGPRLAGVKTRTWPTKEAALLALQETK